MNLDKTVPTFTGIKLNAIEPNKCPDSKKYWSMPRPSRELTWLTDQNRLNDALVYFVSEFDFFHSGHPTFVPDYKSRLECLCAEGRIKTDKWSTYVLAPNSGIEKIREAVAFLAAPANSADVPIPPSAIGNTPAGFVDNV